MEWRIIAYLHAHFVTPLRTRVKASETDMQFAYRSPVATSSHTTQEDHHHVTYIGRSAARCLRSYAIVFCFIIMKKAAITRSRKISHSVLVFDYWQRITAVP